MLEQEKMPAQEPESEEEKKVVEMWTAFEQKGHQGIKEVLHQRNVEYRQEMEKRNQNPTGSPLKREDQR